MGVVIGALAGALLAPRSAAAQPEPFVREVWTVRDGMPVNAVTALLQSRDGYVWVGTFDGLARFDGVRFVLFNAATSAGLPSNRIVRLVETRDGALWVLTEELQLVRFRDGTFTHFGPARGITERVFALHEGADGTLWVGTERGLGTVRGERFERVAPETVRGEVRTILGRADGSTWAGTAEGGVFRVRGGTATALAVGSALGAEQVLALYEDPHGALWIGTNRGVWRWPDAPAPDRASQPVRVLRTEDQRSVAFRASPRTGEVWVQTPSRVYRMGSGVPVVAQTFPGALFGSAVPLPDSAGRMLYAAGPELHREGRRIHTLDSAAARGTAGATWISAALLDREGSLWLGTRGAGLYRLRPASFRVIGAAEGLPDPNVYTVYEDRAGAVWAGSLGGHVSRVVDGRVAAGGVPARRDYWVRSYLQDRQGRLWIGDAVGVRVCALPDLRCPAPPADPIGAAAVLAMHEDEGGALWFGTAGGLFRLDAGGWRRFARADGAPAAPVRAFRSTTDGALWMGTAGGGLARYHHGRFRLVTAAGGLPSDQVRALHADPDGWLWVGTEGRGLARLDPREWGDGRPGGRIVSYRVRDGLFDEVVHQILPDDAGRLWMSSNRGIFRVDRGELHAFAAGRLARLHSTGYTERDGLRNREANGGSQPAGVRTRDGRLWFATQAGVAVVDPAGVARNRVPPGVVVEQVTAGGAVVPVAAAAPLALGTDQRDLEIAYTAPTFLAPAGVRFRYRLDPYDADWVDAGDRRTAFYTRVPPGRYTFRVSASNSDGVWNVQGAALALTLAPQPWETPAFRWLAALGLTLGLGLATAGGVSWRVRRLRARTRELALLVDARTGELRASETQLRARNAQLAELHEARSRLFANLSHEFRTPLTLILGPVRGMVDGRHGPLPAPARAQGELVLRNGRRLLRLINQVLDLAKLQAGAMALERRPVDLVAFVRATALAFAPLAEGRGVALCVHEGPAAVGASVDADQLEKVVLNLLSNALKFTEPGGTVEVSVAADGDAAVLRVRDTGVGIAPDRLDRVFDRFFQADASSTRRYEGTGIGLALAKELVELHGGTIRVESAPGVGSTFTVRLPRAADESAGWDADALPAPTVTAEHAVGALETEVEAAGEPREDRTTVLVVDDNPDVRAYVRSVFAGAYRVLEAADGAEALVVARAALPDLIVADVMMPELDGLGLGRALKADAMTDAIPVVLLTARAAPEDQVAGLGTGADAYLVKPFDPAVLEATVAGLLAQRRRLRVRFGQMTVEVPAEAPAAEAPVGAAQVEMPVAPAAEALADPVPAAPSALEARLRALVVARLTDEALSPEALAAAAGLSYHQLYRGLRDELHTTPSRFVRGVRVECAAELLRQKAGSVTEVAYAVGFASLSYFNRAFHERFGVAPSAFRHQAGGPD